MRTLSSAGVARPPLAARRTRRKDFAFSPSVPLPLAAPDASFRAVLEAAPGPFAEVGLGAELGTRCICLGNIEVKTVCYDKLMAEREGFEPPVRLPVLRISSAARSTTLPPLRGRD